MTSHRICCRDFPFFDTTIYVKKMHAHILPRRKSNLYFKLRDRAASTFRPPQSSQVSLMLRQSFSLSCFFFNACSFGEKNGEFYVTFFLQLQQRAFKIKLKIA